MVTTNGENIMDNLKEYYKFIIKCKCGRNFGADNKKSNVCPICLGELKVIKSN